MRRVDVFPIGYLFSEITSAFATHLARAGQVGMGVDPILNA